MTVYLLHFNAPLSHARHYIGATNNLEKRLKRHAAGRGACIMKAVRKAGIGWTVARIWEGNYELEKELKRQKHSERYCPICQAKEAAQ